MWLFEVLRSEITVIFIIQHQDVTACEMLTSETDLKQMAQSFRNIWTDNTDMLLTSLTVCTTFCIISTLPCCQPSPITPATGNLRLNHLPLQIYK
jgi:hypothetical protein